MQTLGRDLRTTARGALEVGPEDTDAHRRLRTLFQIMETGFVTSVTFAVKTIEQWNLKRGSVCWQMNSILRPDTRPNTARAPGGKHRPVCTQTAPLGPIPVSLPPQASFRGSFWGPYGDKSPTGLAQGVGVLFLKKMFIVREKFVGNSSSSSNL